jgi:hypothetical protein
MQTISDIGAIESIILPDDWVDRDTVSEEELEPAYSWNPSAEIWGKTVVRQLNPNHRTFGPIESRRTYFSSRIQEVAKTDAQFFAEILDGELREVSNTEVIRILKAIDLSGPPIVDPQEAKVCVLKGRRCLGIKVNWISLFVQAEMYLSFTDESRGSIQILDFKSPSSERMPILAANVFGSICWK